MEREGGWEKEKYTGSVMTVTRPDTPLCEAPACSRGEDGDMEGEMEKEGGRDKEKYTGSIMTVTRPDTPLCKSPACSRGEDDDMPLGDEMPEWTISARSSDNSSTTSVASEETVCW